MKLFLMTSRIALRNIALVTAVLCTGEAILPPLDHAQNSRDGRCVFDTSQLVWYACRLDTLQTANFTVSQSSIPENMLLIRKKINCVPADVPGTILTTLLRSGAFPGVTDPFDGDSLRHIPDIAAVGPAYYTYVFMASVKWASAHDCKDLDLNASKAAPMTSHVASGRLSDPASRTWLTLRGISYRAEVYSDGSHLYPRESVGFYHDAVGMNHRWSYDLDWQSREEISSSVST